MAIFYLGTGIHQASHDVAARDKNPSPVEPRPKPPEGTAVEALPEAPGRIRAALASDYVPPEGHEVRLYVGPDPVGDTGNTVPLVVGMSHVTPEEQTGTIYPRLYLVALASGRVRVATKLPAIDLTPALLVKTPFAVRIAAGGVVDVAPRFSGGTAPVDYALHSSDRPGELALSESSLQALGGGYAATIVVRGTDAIGRTADLEVSLTVDAAVPVLSSAAAETDGAEGGTGSLETDMGGGKLYWVVTKAATPPSPDRLTAGLDAAGNVAVDAGSVSVTAPGLVSVVFVGLVRTTTYHVHYLHRLQGIDSAVASATFVTAAPIDDVAPKLSGASATAEAPDRARGQATTDEASGRLYWVVIKGAPPTAADVVAGLDTDGRPAAASGDQPVIATGPQSILATGLSAATDYAFHAVHKDAAGNHSTVVHASFRTQDAPDTTKPILSNAVDEPDGSFGWTGSVETDEAGGTLYVVLTTSETAPTPTQVKAGLDHDSITAAAKAVVAVDAAGTVVVSGSALLPKTTYYAHYMHEDAVGNHSSILTADGLSTAALPDLTEPKLTNAIDTANGRDAATGSVETDEVGGTLYWIVAAGSATPLANQVKLGQNSTGTAAAASGAQSVDTAGTQTLSPAPTGLKAATFYKIYFLHTDAAGNDSAIASGDGFVTDPAESVEDVVLSGFAARVTGSEAAEIDVNVSHGPGTLYWVRTQSASAPTKLQIETGRDATGTEAPQSESASVSAPGAKTFFPSGMGAETTYHIHAFYRSDDGLRESVVAGFSFKTLAATTGIGSAADLAIQEFSQDKVIFDGGRHRGRNEAHIRFQGTCANATLEGRVVEMLAYRSGTLSWVDVGPVVDGAWDGWVDHEMEVPWVRPTFRIKGGDGSTKAAANRFAVGAILARWAQSDEHHLWLYDGQGSVKVPAVLNEDCLQVATIPRSRLSNAQPFQSAAKFTIDNSWTAPSEDESDVDWDTMPPAYARAANAVNDAGGYKTLLLLHAVSGHGIDEQAENRDRHWSDERQIHAKAITEADRGQKAGHVHYFFSSGSASDWDREDLIAAAIFGIRKSGANIASLPITLGENGPSKTVRTSMSEFYDWSYARLSFMEPYASSYSNYAELMRAMAADATYSDFFVDEPESQTAEGFDKGENAGTSDKNHPARDTLYGAARAGFIYLSDMLRRGQIDQGPAHLAIDTVEISSVDDRYLLVGSTSGDLTTPHLADGRDRLSGKPDVRRVVYNGATINAFIRNPADLSLARKGRLAIFRSGGWPASEIAKVAFGTKNQSSNSTGSDVTNGWHKGHYLAVALAGDNYAMADKRPRHGDLFTNHPAYPHPAKTGDATQPMLSALAQDSVGKTSTRVRVTTNEGGGAIYVVVDDDLPAPSKTQMRQLVAATGGTPRGAGTIAVDAGPGTYQIDISGLRDGELVYAYAMHRDAAGNNGEVIQIGPYTPAAPNDGGQGDDGIPTGGGDLKSNLLALRTSDSVGRISTAAQKVAGVDALPAGASLSGRVVNLNGGVTLEDWRFDGYALRINGANCILRNSTFSEANSRSGQGYMVWIETKAHNTRIENNDFIGSGMHEGAGTAIQSNLQGSGSTFAAPSGQLIAQNRFSRLPEDAVRLHGQFTVEFNDFAEHQNYPAGTTTWSSSRTYSSGDVALSSDRFLFVSKTNNNRGNALPSSKTGSTTHWFGPDPHCDIINVRSVTAPSTIRYNRLDQRATHAVGMNAAFWLAPNANKAWPMGGGLDVIGNLLTHKPDQFGRPIRAERRASSSFGAFRIRHNFLGTDSKGNHYYFPNGGVAVWESNEDVGTGAVIAAPSGANTNTTLRPDPVFPGGSGDRGDGGTTDGDIIAPVLTQPSNAADSAASATGTVSTTEGGGVLYSGAWPADKPPADATAVIAGTGAVAVTSQPVIVPGTQAISISGLDANTAYAIHYVHRDAAGNVSAVAVAAGFKTPAVGGDGPGGGGNTPSLVAKWALTNNLSDDYEPSSFVTSGAPLLILVSFYSNGNGADTTTCTIGSPGRSGGGTALVPITNGDNGGRINTWGFRIDAPEAAEQSLKFNFAMGTPRSLTIHAVELPGRTFVDGVDSWLSNGARPTSDFPYDTAKGRTLIGVVAQDITGGSQTFPRGIVLDSGQTGSNKFNDHGWDLFLTETVAGAETFSVTRQTSASQAGTSAIYN